MVIIIPYKLDDGEQLRLTLRSIERHTKHYVILSGDKPDWYTGAHLERHDDKQYHAQLDSTLNIYRAMQLIGDNLEQEAIIWADDIAALRTHRLTTDRYLDTLDHAKTLRPANRHLYKATSDYLNARHLPNYAYILHTPYKVNVAQYLDIVAPVIDEMMRGKKLLTRSIYQNSVRDTHEQGKDCKIYTAHEAIDRTQPFVSTLHPMGRAYDELVEMFNRPSQWESV